MWLRRLAAPESLPWVRCRATGGGTGDVAESEGKGGINLPFELLAGHLRKEYWGKP